MNRAWKQRNAAKVRLAAQRAKIIRQAIRQSVDLDNLLQAFANAGLSPEMKPAQVREWVRVNGFTRNEPLKRALRILYADGYLLGQDVGMSAIARARISKAPTLRQLRRAIGINWSKWRPGNRSAALLVQTPRGLANLLDRSGVVIQGVNGTTLDRIGTVLARALASGWSPSEIRDDLEDLLDDPERALSIAQTETSRAVSVANRELYEESGVELVEWLTAEPCDICEENEDASPIQIGAVFPSGDYEPPAHPNCRCDLAPYVVDTKEFGTDALDLLLED